jgi:hypothetical protein
VVEVTAVEFAKTPLFRVLGEQVGRAIVLPDERGRGLRRRGRGQPLPPRVPAAGARRALAKRAQAGPGCRSQHAGKGTPYDEVHWFWSDQYDANLQYAGFHTAWDELAVRGSFEDRNFVAFYLKDKRILASVAMNRGKDLRRSMPLIKSQVQVEPARLRDETVELSVLRGQSPAASGPPG